MERTRILLSRCAAILRGRKLDADLDDELRAHLEIAIEENMKRGLSRKSARIEALREFGGVTQIKESYRVQRGLPLAGQLVRDVRFAIRQLRNSPGFALTAIFTLALGIGANTAVFSLMNALLLRPLPVPRAGDLAVIHFARTDDADPNYSFSAPMFRALEKRREVFESVGSFSSRKMQVRAASGNVDVSGAIVSGDFFRTLEVPPLMGRYLTPQDDRKGGTSTGFGVVISESFWQSWFNRASDVVGQRLTIANAPFTVVGVMPKSFIGADPTRRPEIYVPLWAEPVIDTPYDNITAGHHSWWMRVIARRRAGVTLEQANAALASASNAILDETAPDDPKWIKEFRDQRFRLLAAPGSEGYSYLQLQFFKPLVAVFSLCAAMLLLACLNLASLLMARSAARERELATRLAMGATRRRLIQQLMVESLLIAVLGTAAGILAAPAVSQALAALLLGNDSNSILDTSLDLQVFAFIAVSAMASCVMIGLVPALRATSKNLNEQIKSGSRNASAGERRRLLPRVLMGFEVALALMLVVGAGLLATSLTRLYRSGFGFEPRGVANLSLDMGKQGLDGDALVRWYQSYGDSIAKVPGVESVAFASNTPMDGSVWTSTYSTLFSNGERQLHMSRVSPGFFQAMRIPRITGRDFRWDDSRTSGPKIVLNEAAAKLLFPGMNNVVGQHISNEKKPLEVIGIVGDIRYASLREDPPPGAYLALTQDEGKKPSYTCVVRFGASPDQLAPAARRLAAEMAPEIPAPVLTTLGSDIDASISSERMMAMLAVFFAGCALLITAIGLYGTLAYATARRTSEIGIRMALGARRTQVVLLVFRENAWTAACGSLLGLGAALIASRGLASFLYGISARDPWVMTASVVTLGAIATAASLVPAIRAARIEPITALRME